MRTKEKVEEHGLKVLTVNSTTLGYFLTATKITQEKLIKLTTRVQVSCLLFVGHRNLLVVRTKTFMLIIQRKEMSDR